MGTNKNAVLRYNVLDKCFQNFGRKYYFEDLLEIVNNALIEDHPSSSGIQVRQLREDIRFMKSKAGYSAPILAYKEGKKAYYRYDDKRFSINNCPLNATEAEQLKSAISILQRFEGSPEFEWVNEISPMLTDQFGLKNTNQKVMAYESNIDYSGYKFITPIFNAIINRRVLEIKYEPFNKEAFNLNFHPYFLKQFNNRWFTFGCNEELNIETWNMALDRIQLLKQTNKKYIVSSTNWEDHFYDIIGVTRPNQLPTVIELLFSKEQAPYIQTKPLHPSQKSKLLEDGTLYVRLSLIQNYELEMKLLSFCDKVRVLAPKKLQKTIQQRLKWALDQY